jgi:uncharacterized membrane protein
MSLWWVALPLLIALAIWASMGNRGGPDKPPESALEVPRRRYAKGDIDRYRYQRMLGDLGGG